MYFTLISKRLMGSKLELRDKRERRKSKDVFYVIITGMVSLNDPFNTTKIVLTKKQMLKKGKITKTKNKI